MTAMVNQHGHQILDQHLGPYYFRIENEGYLLVCCLMEVLIKCLSLNLCYRR
jgi:hypothetical protein